MPWGTPARCAAVGSVPLPEGAAPLQGLAVAGQGTLDQLASLLRLGDPGVDLLELGFGEGAPPATRRAAPKEPAHLPDREPRVAQQPDDRQAAEDGWLIPAATAHPSGGTQQAGLLVEPKRGRTEPGARGDLADGKQLVR